MKRTIGIIIIAIVILLCVGGLIFAITRLTTSNSTSKKPSSETSQSQSSPSTSSTATPDSSSNSNTTSDQSQSGSSSSSTQSQSQSQDHSGTPGSSSLPSTGMSDPGTIALISTLLAAVTYGVTFYVRGRLELQK